MSQQEKHTSIHVHTNKTPKFSLKTYECVCVIDDVMNFLIYACQNLGWSGPEQKKSNWYGLIQQHTKNMNHRPG